MHKNAYADPSYRILARLARSYYPDDGPNSWQHIQEVRRRAAKMMRRLEERRLSPVEYAAILMHDSTKRDMGKNNHGRLGALRAAEVLAAALPKDQLAEAVEAISVHDDNLPKFPSRTAELLASADANPPDTDWMLNKSYNWAIMHGLKGKDRYKHSVDTLPQKYGVGGKFNIPGIYSKYYGEAVRRNQEVLSKLTVEEAKKRLDKYRAKYGIGPDEPRVIHNV